MLQTHRPRKKTEVTTQLTKTWWINPLLAPTPRHSGKTILRAACLAPGDDIYLLLTVYRSVLGKEWRQEGL